jgi:hypothetical protein
LWWWWWWWWWCFWIRRRRAQGCICIRNSTRKMRRTVDVKRKRWCRGSDESVTRESHWSCVTWLIFTIRLIISIWYNVHTCG